MIKLPYETYFEFPPWMKFVVRLYFLGAPITSIAQHYGRPEADIQKIIDHDVMQEYLRGQRIIQVSAEHDITALMQEMSYQNMQALKEQLADAQLLDEMRRKLTEDLAKKPKQLKEALKALPPPLTINQRLTIQKFLFDYQPNGRFKKTTKLDHTFDDQVVGQSAIEQLKKRGLEIKRKVYTPEKPEPIQITAEVTEKEENSTPIDSSPPDAP